MYAANVCVKCWRQMLASNVCVKCWRISKIYAANVGVQSMRNCEITAPHNIRQKQGGRWNLCAYQNICAKCMRPSENWRPSSASAYYLGSAESLTSDFFQVWLKSSRSGDVASRSCSPQVTWALRPPSLYGRRLSRTVPAVVPARLVKISALCPNICGRIYFHYFLGKNQKSVSACKCPITALKIHT